MLSPVDIISFGEIVSCMSSTRFLSVFSCINCHFCLQEKVLELKCLNEIGVPDVTSVGNANMLILLRNLMEFGASFL